MSTNLHIDDIGNLIFRDGKLGLFVSSQYVAPPHYGGGWVGALSLYAVELVNHYYPYGGLFAESTGGEKQAFKYNGKELDRVCGLNWYDHGARHNDAAIGRWHCVDPLAHKYYSISPYAYCADNPVNCVDTDGRDVFDVSCSGVISVNLGPTFGTHLRFLDTQKREIGKTTLTWTTNEFDQKMTDLSGDGNQYTAVSPSQGFQILKALGEYQHADQGSEWTLAVAKNGKVYIATSHSYWTVSETANKAAMHGIGIEATDIAYKIHLHPGRDSEDGSQSAGTKGPSQSDIVTYRNAKNNLKKGEKMYRAFIYHQGTGKVYEYNEKGVIKDKDHEWDNIEAWFKSMSK